ncbi:TPA: hypothetical protein HA265_00900 [Candidatus Woesearchaeota archaeon]|nr:hypothetical protein [Candidatus Woesearchaeota archaeon]
MKKNMMIYVLTSIMLVSAMMIAGCWQTPKLAPERKTVALGPQEVPEVPVEDDQVTISDSGPEEKASPSEKPAAEEAEGPKVTASDDIEKPDCDGRLIASYNIYNEITGYRCETDSQDFECPGHRAGETWTADDGCTECTCKSSGSIVCTDEGCQV